MRIAYVAKHGSGFNDDEGAIAYALTSLGHNVDLIPESAGETVIGAGYDLLLFHKWYDKQVLRYVPRTVKAFWYFDMVGNGGDRKLFNRSRQRVDWMKDIVPLVDVGFCTDGDFVAEDRTKKLVHLMQGADGRITGRGPSQLTCPSWGDKLLFTGTAKGAGDRRSLFIDRMIARYKTRFVMFKNMYRENLRSVTGSIGGIICPDFPVTDRYWSNRVYNAAGFGGVVFHKRSEGLLNHYDPNEIIYYDSMEELHHQIDVIMSHPEESDRVRDRALARTMNDHTYTNRCKTLLKVIAERFGVV